MMRIAIAVTTLALFGLPLVQAVDAEFNVNVNVGVPVAPVPVPPVYESPRIVLSSPPEFILLPALGFYVAVGVPQDLVFIEDVYYIYRSGRWYSAPYYNGPWRHVERRHLPPGLRRHKFEKIRHYRDEEYGRYREGHDSYRGRHFRPDKEWKEERKEEKRYEKERRKEEKRYEKEEKHREKEERRMEREEGRGHGRHGGRE